MIADKDLVKITEPRAVETEKGDFKTDKIVDTVLKIVTAQPSQAKLKPAKL